MEDKILCLGTAKIDNIDYGFSSFKDYLESEKLLEYASKKRIRWLDTSPRYNKSESIIGNFMKNTRNQFSVSTKIDNLEANNANTPDLMINSIRSSIKKLNKETIDLCYLHQNEMKIISDKYVLKGIRILIDNGLIKEAGTSIYNKKELLFSLDCPLYSWIQTPINIYNTYFYKIINENKSKKKIAARSIFMQGLIFQSQKNLQNFNFKNEYLSQRILTKRILNDYNLGIDKASVSFLFSLEKINMVIFGTQSKRNLNNIINDCSYNMPDRLSQELLSQSSLDDKWKNPRNWTFKN